MDGSRPHRSLSAVCIATLLLASFLLASPSVQAKDRTFVIEMKNIQFSPNPIQADQGDVLTIHVFNNDTTGHTFDITEFNIHIGTRTSPLLPGENATTTFTADRAGTFWFFCDIPGHAAVSGSGYTGMAGRLVVGQPSGPLNLTIVFLVAGVAAAAGLIGVLFWLRRRPRKP